MPCLTRTFSTRATIIGLLACLLLPWLAGCAAMKMAYSNGQQLTWWWLDGYADFTGEQTPIVKQGIASFFDWHRRTQLPVYATVLVTLQSDVTEPTTPAQACRWETRLRDMLEPSIDHALGQAADLLPTLGEAQIKSMEAKYAKLNDDFRDDYLQSNPAKREAAALKRALERPERLYGPLDAPQKRVLKDGLAASPLNPEMLLAERQRRQRDTVQTLRRLLAERPDREHRLAALRTLVARSERSPDPEYRAYQIKLNDYNCGLSAQLHNATTPAQRRQARDNLKGWEDDARSLMNAAW